MEQYMTKELRNDLLVLAIPFGAGFIYSAYIHNTKGMIVAVVCYLLAALIRPWDDRSDNFPSGNPLA
jgi:hypothetical protein